MHKIDDIDRKLLRLMQAEPEIAIKNLAEDCALSTATAWRRLERLQSSGILQAQEAVINWAALGYEVEVSLRITLDKTQRNAFDDFLEAARDVPEVNEIQTFLGRVDVRLNVLARDMKHYQDIYRSRILTLPHIADIEALMLVSEVKNSEALPL